MQRKPPLTPALLAAFAITATPIASASIERTFAVSPGGSLVVDAEASDVRISGGADQARIAVLRGNDDDADIRDDFDVAFHQSGDRVQLTIRVRDRSFWRRIWPERRHLRVDVDLPREFDVDVKTSGGDLRVVRLSGNIDVHTSGGDIRFRDVDGPIRGRTSGGDIRLDGTSGTADIETSGGDIELGSIGGEVTARTSGGDISVRRANAAVQVKTSGGNIVIREAAEGVQATTSGGSVRAHLSTLSRDSSLTTSGGSITLRVPEDAAFSVDARTGGGNVAIDEAFALTSQGTSSRSRFTGTVNGGGPDVRLRTSGGTIRIEPHEG